VGKKLTIPQILLVAAGVRVLNWKIGQRIRGQRSWDTSSKISLRARWHSSRAFRSAWALEMPTARGKLILEDVSPAR